jgi:DNA uptake protein ComE-like DNA-binding protein
MRYRIHTAYVSSSGALVPQGVYDADEISLIEARQRSIVTNEDAALVVTNEITPLAMPVVQLGTDNDSLDLVPEVTQTTVDTIDINKINKTDLIALKYVGTKTATAVLTQRNVKSFTGYLDLNKRAPLPRNRKWEDAHNIKFDVVEVFDNTSLGLQVTEV